MKTLAQRLALLALALCVAQAARADEGPGIRVKLENLTGPATAGSPLTMGVEITAGHAVTLRSFSLRGGTSTGGGPPVTGLPDSLPLAAGVPAHLTVQTIPTGGDLIYKLQFQMGSKTVVNFFDLSRQHFDRMFRSNQSVTLPDVLLPAVAPGWDTDPGLGAVEMRPSFLKPLRDVRTTPAGVRAVTGRNVRVKGQVTYTRDDGVTVGADHLCVKILDQETGPSDDLLDEIRTSANGSFDVNVWSDEDEPDLYLEFATRNGAAEVQDGTWNSSYKWETGVKVDFTGSTADFGNRTPPDSWIKLAVHMHTNLTRGWRWYASVVGVTPPKQALEWPSGDWPHYDPFGGDLHIPYTVAGVSSFSWAWKTGVHLHEYGHTITNEVQNYSPSHDYDNGVCNNPNGDPGHCLFCQEDGGTAIKEGWANYFADQVLDAWPGTYGGAPNETRDQESLGSCMDNSDPQQSCACNPFTTEGHLGRLLNDLADNTPAEVDGLASPGGADLLSVGAANVCLLFHWYDIDSPSEYITRFRQQFTNVDQGQLWATLANNQYVLADNTAPAVPTGFHSTDHAVNVQSTDATIGMAWNPATDDFSGIDHYEIWYRTAPNGSWIALTDQTDTDVSTGYLSVGWYDFRIRSIDRAGNASAMGQLGSFGVRDPYPADLTSNTPSGWESNFVPRDANDATTTSCPLPAQLDGGVANTYLNVAGRNAGETATDANNRVRLLIDGAPVDSVTFGFIGVGGTFQTRNRGPRTVRGGRHTLEAWYDASELNHEQIETNNRVGHQYTWVGEKIGINTRERRSAPPDPTGGHNSFFVLPPAVKFKNVDGLYYSHTRTFPPFTYSWAALWVAPLANTANYDCYIGTHSTGTQDGGYTTGLVTSARSAGLLDAVITNTANSWDVGVLNTSKSSSDYMTGSVVSGSTALVVGDSAIITLADSVMMAMRMFTSPSGSEKTLVQVQRTSGTSPLYTLWLANDYTYGTISQYDGKVGTNASGFSSLTVTTTGVAEHGLAFYRNPIDGWGPVTFVVRVIDKPGDAAAITPAGWHSALVPRPLGDGSAPSVPAPASLTGESAVTYLNASITNTSDAATESFRADVRIDRTLLSQLNYPFGIAANAQVKANNFAPTLLTAGRHVLHMELDAAGTMSEVDETNNTFGEQWVWAPPVSPLATPLWRRGTNGGPVEGWDACDPAASLAFDVDGLRSPVFTAGNSAGWAGFAITPRPGSDVDLQLHDLATSPTDGFDEALAFSQWDGDATDFVLVDFAVTGYRAFDMGVVRASDDTTSYLGQIVGATLRAPAAGVHGPFTLPGGRVLELHAMDLAAGHYVVDLVNQTGTVDWGFAAYAGPRPYQNRSDGEDLDVSAAGGPGGNEQLEFDVPSAQRVCFAVWKNSASEQGKSGTYALAVNTAWLGADASGPASTRLLGARPSPFTTGTEIAFDLATPDDVLLEVFDVRGGRVSTLARGPYAAGHHRVSWGGADDAGRRLPVGIYLVRLRAGNVSATSKVVRTD